LEDRVLLLIKIHKTFDIADSMDFIWRKENGLRLKTDWSYPDGEPNKSFEKWVGA
jgi:hypothetical protein